MSTEPNQTDSQREAVTEVDPYEIVVSDQNERRENADTNATEEDDANLEESIEKRGIVQPPVVRPNDDPDRPYEVIIGQRRVSAAQAVGLDRIPVVVMDYGDPEALAASVTENIRAFENDVSREDRARAVRRLKELNDWTNRGLADELGVSSGMVTKWLERTREEWQGTEIDPTFENDENGEDTGAVVVTKSSEETESSTTEEQTERTSFDDVPDGTIQEVRRAVGGGKRGEDVVKHIKGENLSVHETEEVAQRVERGQDPAKAVEQVAELKRRERESEAKVSTRVKFVGKTAEALQRAAKDMNTSDEDAVRVAVERYLNEHNYTN